MNELLKRIILVHKCVGCREILDYKYSNDAFCPSCKEKYLSSRMAICPICSLEAERCRCVPPLLKKDKILSLRRLYFYSKDREAEPQNRLIYFIKKNRTKRVNNFVAGELLPLINAELGRFEINEIPLIVGVPRSSGSLTEYGFDQSDLLCRAIANRCALEHCRVLKRRRGRAQKSLTAGQRRKNIKNLIYADKALVNKINGRTVILLDDIVTTGASMSACIHVLRSYGAKNILCIALASDIKK